MTNEPPDRKEAGDAPEGPRNPYLRFIAWSILSLVLYVLSAGPVIALAENHHLPVEVMAIYLPLEYLPYPLKILLLDYLRWWGP